MSGPKGIGVAPVAVGVPLVPILLVTAAAAAGTYAVVKLTEHYLEQKRLAERVRQKKDDFDELIRELNDLGDQGEHLKEQADSTLERAEKMAEEGKVEEAAALLDRQLGELESCRQIALARIHDRATRMQRKSRGVHKLAANQRLARQRLEQQAASAITEEWTSEQAEQIRSILSQGLESVSETEPPEFEAGAGFETTLDAAETSLRSNGETLAQLENELRTAIDGINKDRLKDKLGVSGFRAVSLSDFLDEQEDVEAPEDPILEKLDGLMAKIAALRDTAGWNDLLRRANSIRTELDDAKRTLLYEDLVLDAGKRLKELNAVVAWQKQIEEVLEDAAPYEGTAVDDIVAELRRLHRAGRIVQIDELTKRLQETQTAELKRLDAERRRQAILESLNELGYETQEGMETALVEGGKMVLRKPNEADYAVEMVTNPDLSVVQTAMVRYSDSEELTEQQRLRDIEKEEAWCEDHARMLHKLDENGMEMQFKVKLAPGEHPVKVVKRDKQAEVQTQAKRSLEK